MKTDTAPSATNWSHTCKSNGVSLTASQNRTKDYRYHNNYLKYQYKINGIVAMYVQLQHGQLQQMQKVKFDIVSSNHN